jgi:hypothetical protein
MRLSVLGESLQMERSLLELPYTLIEIMSPHLTRKFAEMIENYHYKFRELEPTIVKEEEHENLCIAMFRSVQTPYVYEYDDEIMAKSFTQNLTIQILERVPGLRKIYFSKVTRINRSTELARMITHIRELQVFTYMSHCTDEVIEQLGLHCPHLKEVSVIHSRDVTNTSVPHSLKLGELPFLNLFGSRIDDEHYRLLIAELPKIKNIELTHFSGGAEYVNNLIEKCRNITKLDIHAISRTIDLSGLTTLTSLRSLYVSSPDYATSSLNAVLTDIGPRLTNLTLYDISNVNFQDIVSLCPSLESLVLFSCSYLPLNADTPLDSQLPHFKNLISLNINNNPGDEMNYNYIRHYVSLKTIKLNWINIFTVEFMREIVNSGTFANLEEFYISEYGHGALTMECVELLMQRCLRLKKIGYFRYWRRFDPALIQELKRGILEGNFDLEVI